MTEDWHPTAFLRWSKEGDLQQRWSCRIIEPRSYGGQPRYCERFEHQWRDIPTEGQPDALDQREWTDGACDNTPGTAIDEPGRARDKRNGRHAEVQSPDGPAPTKS